MRLLPFVAIALLLPLQPFAEAAPNASAAPAFNPGDFWKYTVSDGTGKPLNFLSVTVRDERDVRQGNATVRAYNLTERLTPWLPAVETNLSDKVRYGPVYTIVETNVTIARKDLSRLSSASNISNVHYSDVTHDHEYLTYSPGDGRLRFPLSAGQSWNATFDRTRVRQYEFRRIVDNATITRTYVCEAYEKLPDGKEGFRIRSGEPGGGPETVSWFSPAYGADVRREERDGAGNVLVYTLVKHGHGQVQSIFSNPQTMLALAFGVAAVAMLAGAAFSAYRARNPVTRSGKKKDAAAPPAAPPPPAKPAGKAPGRSL
jgi:hypothetical protein